MISSVLVIFVLMSGTIAVAQNTASGTVKSRSGQVLFPANVIAYSNTGAFGSFCSTDVEGNWLLRIDTSVAYLEASYLGYKNQRIDLDSLANLEAIMFVLEPSSFLTDSEDIVAERIYIKVDGDTITYDIEGYQRLGDRSLGEVLNRLEGVYIDDSGSIMYKGKRIDKLLLSGRDILNDQHGLATDGIRLEDVEKIEIIENYRDFRNRTSFLPSSKVALDIQLRDSVARVYRYDLEAAAGASHKYSVDASGYQAGANFGHTEFLRSNNVGKANLDAGTYGSLQSSYLEVLNRTGGKPEDAIPLALRPVVGRREQSSHTASLVYESTSSKGTRHSFRAIGDRIDQSGQRKSDIYLIGDSLQIDGVFQNDAGATLWFGRYVMQGEHGWLKDTEIDVSVKGISQRMQSAQSYNRRLIGDDTDTKLSDISGSWSVTMPLFVASTHQMSIEYSGLLTDKQDRREISTEQALLSDFTRQLRYESPERTVQHEAKLTYEHSSGLWRFRSIVLGESDKLDTESSWKDFASFETLRQVSIESSREGITAHQELRWKNERKQLHLEGSISAVQQRVDLLERSTDVLYNFFARYAHPISLNSKIAVNARLSANIAPLDNFRNMLLISEQNILRRYNLKAIKTERKQSIFVFHEVSQIVSGLHLFTNLSISQSFNPVAITYEPLDNTLLESISYADRSKSLQTTSFLLKRLNSSTRWSARGLYIITQFEADNLQRNEMLNLSSSISKDFTNYLSAKLSLAYNRNRIDQVSLQHVNRTYTASLKLKLGFAKWNLSTTLAYQQNRNSIARRDVVQFGLKGDYVFSKHWTLTITGNNVNNLAGRTITSSEIRLFKSVHSEYRDFPGFLMIGVRYKN